MNLEIIGKEKDILEYALWSYEQMVNDKEVSLTEEELACLYSLIRRVSDSK